MDPALMTLRDSPRYLQRNTTIDGDTIKVCVEHYCIDTRTVVVIDSCGVIAIKHQSNLPQDREAPTYGLLNTGTAEFSTMPAQTCAPDQRLYLQDTVYDGPVWT